MDDNSTCRSEILFYFETNNNNPNGNPIFENRPRIDEVTGECLISPYRIKRTVRDYLRMFKKEKILVNNYEIIEEEYFSNSIENNLKKEITSPLDLKRIIFNNFIDTRLFGIALPFKGRNKSIEIYGPVQFTYARSMFPVVLLKNQGTAAYASELGRHQRSFRTEFIIPYALFFVYGNLNENVAALTSLSKNDVVQLEDALWNGTNNIHSRTKVGCKSRLLLRIEYKKKLQLNFMNNPINSIFKITPEKIRKINHIQLDIDNMIDLLSKNKEKIRRIRIKEEEISIKDYKKVLEALEEHSLPCELIEV